MIINLTPEEVDASMSLPEMEWDLLLAYLGAFSCEDTIIEATT